MERDDALFIEQLRRGEVPAGQRFAREYLPLVHRHFLAITGRPEDAEDLTQETMLAAWRSLPAFEGRSSLKTWLFAIARNVFREWLRGRPPAEAADLREAAEVPDARAAQAIDAVLMRLALAALPAEEREATLLYYQEGFTCREIAEMIGIPEGTVKYRLHEARARLFRELGRGEEER